jgi:hypothetical protein
MLRDAVSLPANTACWSCSTSATDVSRQVACRRGGAGPLE